MSWVVLWDTACNFNAVILNQSIFNCLITIVSTLATLFINIVFFCHSEPPHEAMSGPSVACMKGEQGVLISLLAKRRPLALGWSYGVFALSPKNRKLYQFKSELVSGT